LLFKLKDNARTLTAVALLVAMILTAMGTIYSVYAVVRDDVMADTSHSLQVNRGAGAADLPVDARRISAILQEHGLDIQHEWYLMTVWAEAELLHMDTSVILVPYSL